MQLWCRYRLAIKISQAGRLQIPKQKTPKTKFGMLNTNPGITLISIMVFHFSKIGKVVRNQICLDTNPNMYLVANSSVVFLLYTVGSVKIQVWEKRKSMFGKRKIPVCWPVAIKSTWGFVYFQVWCSRTNFGNPCLVSWESKLVFGRNPCLENLYYFHVWKIFNFHTNSIQYPYKIPIGKFANFSSVLIIIYFKRY